jgi:hypothetical protein
MRLALPFQLVELDFTLFREIGATENIGFGILFFYLFIYFIFFQSLTFSFSSVSSATKRRINNFLLDKLMFHFVFAGFEQFVGEHFAVVLDVHTKHSRGCHVSSGVYHLCYHC